MMGTENTAESTTTNTSEGGGEALRVYHCLGSDWVVARSVEDATAVLRETHGTHGTFEVNEGDTIDPLPDDKPLTIREENDHGYVSTTMTCGEWARITGRGYLAGESF